MAGKLKPLDVARETRPGKYPDGDGLYLIVASATSKNWSYRYWKDGKQRWLGLGSFKDVSLKDARLARDAARLRVKGDRSTPGVDIVQERREAREEQKAVEIKAVLPTFEECAEAYIRQHWTTWSEKHRDQWPSSLKRYAYPTIGKLTIPEIKPSHIYELLRPIWVEKRETANRVRGRIETIIAKNVDVDDQRFPKSRRTHETTARETSKAAQACRAAPSCPTIYRGIAVHTCAFQRGWHRRGDVALSDLHRMPNQRSGRSTLVGDRSALIDLENSRRTHEDAPGSRCAAVRSCSRYTRQDARWRQRRIDLPESRGWSIFGECHARRTGPPRLRSRYRAWIPLDLRNLGRRMHRLSRWRPRGSARAQIQIRDHGSLSARAKAREATRPHERLGAIPRRIKCHPLRQNRLVCLGQLSLRQPTTDPQGFWFCPTVCRRSRVRGDFRDSRSST